jgi:hypothetical protein
MDSWSVDVEASDDTQDIAFDLSWGWGLHVDK